MVDLTKRVKTRRKKLQKAWATDEWDKEKKKFLAEFPNCKWCGKPAVLPHHPYIKSYKDGTYLDMYLSGCIAMCARCHFSLHRGLLLCPVCKDKYMRVGSEMCYGCYVEKHPEIVEKREEAKEKRKADQKKARKEAYQKAKKKQTTKTINKNKTNK